LEENFHAKVARALARKLNLSRDYERIFVKAIVEPDRWRRKNLRRRHHQLNYYTIIDHVVNAGIYYLRGDISSCLWNLGIALHYIQDAHIPPPRTRNLRRLHSSIERRSISISPTKIEAEVNEAFHASLSSSEFVRRVVSQIGQVHNAEYALKEAIRVSAMITAAVFGPKESPKDLVVSYTIAKEKRKARESKATKSFLAVLGIGFTLSIIVGIVTSVSLIPTLLLLSLFLAGITYWIAAGSDPEYDRLRKEAEWYNIQ